MSCLIKGLGTAVPGAFTQDAAFEHACQLARFTERQTRSLRALYRKTTVQTRHTVLLDETETSQDFYAPIREECDGGPTTDQRMRIYAREVIPLGLRASQQALEQSGTRPTDLTHLITVSCTGFFSPGLDFALIEQLGMPRSIARTNIGFMGCHGMLNAMRVALCTARGYPQSRILICAAELCSLHLQYGGRPETAIANALFSDGASAMVALPDTRGSSDDWTLKDCASFLLPDSAQDMSWRIGNHGFEMTLSDRVPDLIESHLSPWVQNWLASQNLSVSDIGSWAVHPGGPSILDAVAISLHLPAGVLQTSRDVLAAHGNMSSPTVLFILDRLRQQRAPKPCVTLAFGPGLVAEAALIV